MYGNKTHNIKQQTYLDYFKYFSQSALETTRKLESRFQEEFTDDFFCNSQHTFKHIKKLLGSYEVLILEINDSCQFVEIPDFGVCIVKIFFQMMSIIQYLIKNIMKKQPYERMERQKKVYERHTLQVLSTQNCPNMSQMREKESIRLRENAAHILKNMIYEVKGLEMENTTNIQSNVDALEKISNGRKRLETIQSSQSEAVLAQTVTMMFKRGQNINNFINLLQSTQVQNKEAQPQAYSKLKEKMEEQNNSKIEKATVKLHELLKAYAIQCESKKKAGLVSSEVQVVIDDNEQEIAKKRRYHDRRAQSEQIKKLRQDVLNLEDENKGLKDFLKEKTEEFQNKRTQFIADKITLQNKLKQIKQNMSFLEKSKVTLDVKRQEGKQQFSSSFQNLSQIKSNGTIIYDEDRKDCIESPDRIIDVNMQSTQNSRLSRKMSKVKIPKGLKSKVQFQQKVEPPKLQMVSNMINMSIFEPSLEKEAIMSKIEEKQAFLESQNSHSVHAPSVRNSDETEIKVASPVNISYPKHSTPQIEKPKSSFKQVKPTSCRGKMNKTNQFSQYSINEPKMATLEKPRANQIVKKQSILQLLQESGQHRKSNFSMMSNFRSDLSKDNIKISERDGHTTFADIRKCSQLFQDTNRYSQKPVTQVRSSAQFFQLNIKSINTPICFDKEDLSSIFISEQNAKNYEFLNLSLAAKHKKYLSSVGTARKITKSSTFNVKTQIQATITENYKPSEMINILIGTFFDLLTALKKDRNNYCKLSNFLRYPHSSIYQAGSRSWQQFSQEESGIEYSQLRKLIIRFSKFHIECNQPLCKHWCHFLLKLGFTIK